MRKFSCYRGSDDGYDYRRDDRDGYVTAQLKLDEQYREHLRRVEEMKKKEEKKS
jgi:hypothetical protein